MPTAKTALITGGAKRIGAAIARHLSLHGYALVIHYHHSQKEAQTLAAELHAKGGIMHLIQGDLAHPATAQRLIRDARAKLGGLSLLVNNASLFEDDRLETLTSENLTKHMATNLYAPLLLSQAFAAGVKADQQIGASIINIIDQRVKKLTPQYFSYTLSKAALRTATETMAQALAPHIRVNAVAPGPTLPNIHDGADGFAREAAAIPLQKNVMPEEIAAAVLFLAQSPSITGEMIAVDGGQHIGWQTRDVIE